MGLLMSARIGITRTPVVVHVVWNTAAQNIADAQIQSQIDVLNQDFRMTNPDIGQVPAVWQPVAADARIEFFLATEGPDGSPTNGITRTQTQNSSFAQAGNSIKSAATGGANPWPADRYLNIWVAPRITSPQGDLLGYAQFPGGPAATDGVVILHSAFGTSGTAAAPFNQGRTATHEIGHWLNLFHIWGDDGTGCSGSDEVNDTPNAAGPNFGCPAFPSITCNNGPNGDMFINYMDYTNDACMFMFTADQVTRMQAALDGPRVSIARIRRLGDSDDLAGFVREIAAIKHRSQQVVTAVRTQSNTLKLISWRVNNDGSVSRTGDSGGQAGRASNIAIAKGNKYVVACRTSSGNLKLISWDINSAGAITRAGDSGNQAGTASRIKIVAVSDTLFVTACRTSGGNLKLISWQLNNDGSITRLNDSGSAAGAVSEIDLLEIPRSGSGSRVVTSVRDGDGDLKLIVWNVSSGGAISRRGDSGQLAGKATMIRSVRNEFDDVVTAVRAGNTRLKLISWRVSANGNTVSRLDDSGNQAGRIGDNALMSRPDGVLSAVRTQGRNLKLIAWDMTAGGSITRTIDSGDQAGTASRITLCQEALSGDAPIVTAVRTASNNLKLITWKD
jgi:hypothetical protein